MVTGRDFLVKRCNRKTGLWKIIGLEVLGGLTLRDVVGEVGKMQGGAERGTIASVGVV